MFINKIKWVITCTCIILSTTGCGKTIEQQIAEQLELGQKYFAEQDYEQALVAFNKMIEIDPKQWDAYIGIAKIYEAQEKTDQAVQIMEQGLGVLSVEEVPGEDIDFLVDLYRVLADQALQAGDMELTQTCYQKILNLRPEEEDIKARKEELEKVSQHEQEIGDSEIDVKDYLEQPVELIQLLNMQPTDYWQFPNWDSYEKDQFYIEGSNEVFSMKNQGANLVTLYGNHLGDDITQVDTSLTENNWFFEPGNSNDQERTYITILQDKEFMITLYLDANNSVTSWYLNNWPEGGWVEAAFEKIRLNNDFNTQNMTSGWKTAYIDYIEENGKIYDPLIDTYIETYQLININQDSIPELYIDYGSLADGGTLCSYYNDTLIFQNIASLGLSYIEGENLFKNSGGHMDSYYDQIYCIENDKFVLLHNGYYGAPDNSNLQFDSEGYPIYEYYWDNIKIASETEYMTMLNDFFDPQKAIDPFDSTVIGNESYNYENILNVIAEY